MEEKENVEAKGEKKKYTILIVCLLLLILGLVGYIAYDHKLLFSSDVEQEEKKAEKKKETEKENSEPLESATEESSAPKALNLSLCLNNPGVTYSSPTQEEGKYGLSMTINPEQTSITLNIDWNTFCSIVSSVVYGGGTCSQTIESYQITGFTKKVQQVFIGDLGQAANGITLFYLMEDGTVEYTPMFVRKTDAQGNSWYVLNYSGNNAATVHFESSGMVPSAKDVIQFYKVSASNGSGWITTIGATKEGSFYDLGVGIQE